MKFELSFKKIFMIFLVTYPIFDMYPFYNRITTLIRVAIITTMFLYVLIKYKDKKAFLLFFLYFILLGIFFIIHDNHCSFFRSFSPTNFDYNVLEEMLYFVKMTMPLIFIYISYKIKLNKKDIKNIIIALSILISTNIIITNFFVISYSSYSNELIKGNFFSWFFGAYAKYGYMQLASKGWFYFANHTIAILVMILPIIFYYLIEDFNYKKVIILCCHLFALVLLGNRTSVIGTYAILLISIFTYFVFTVIIKRDKPNKKVLIYMILLIIIYPFFIFISPAYQRFEDTKTIVNSVNKETILNINNEQKINYIVEEKEKKINYILTNYKSKMVNPIFFKYYPYEYDTDFWYLEIKNNDKTNFINYRNLEIKILNRVIITNNNKYDKLLGIGHSRHMNIVNYERDYFSQIYSVGIIGLFLLISPYIIILLYLIIKLFNKKNFKLKNILFIYSLGIFLSLALLSGNLLNSLSVTVIFSFIMGIMINEENYAIIKKR
ncbi:MAG: O-antigen ligase family protein [Bacilli bacterium]